jgi:hypothetical protein
VGEHVAAEFVKVDIGLGEHPRAYTLALGEQAEQDVLGADVVVSEFPALGQG